MDAQKHSAWKTASVETAKRVLARVLRLTDRRTVAVFAAGALFTAAAGTVSFVGLEITSTTPFCLSCHEMRVVGEQGWKRSIHYANGSGVVAECHDCHVPPEPLPLLWTKTRDGVKDVVVHYLGESDPERMPWDRLAASARRKISDSACKTCHANPTPAGASLKMIMAHREYKRMHGRKRCLDCHTRAFHGEFRSILETRLDTRTGGGTR